MGEVVRALGGRLESKTALEDVTDEAFEAAFRSLQRRLRAPYELHVQGVAHAEIARRLGLPEDAVAELLREARGCLRASLACRAASREDA